MAVKKKAARGGLGKGLDLLIPVEPAEKEEKDVVVLGTPDEGEFSGQTRFLTMPNEYKEFEKTLQRTTLNLFNDFTALVLMTDGITDPYFETEQQLNNVATWDSFWLKHIEKILSNKSTSHKTTSNYGFRNKILATINLSSHSWIEF